MIAAVPRAASLTRDLQIDGVGLATVGGLGLILSFLVIADNAARIIVPWLIVLVVLGLAQVVIGGGWLRNAVDDAVPAPADLAIEPPSDQLRRAGLPTVVAAALLALALLAVPPFAPIVAGLAMGAAMTDLRSRKWIHADERARGVTIMREATRLPFANARKRLWVLEDVV